jgi:hypothetical protein
MNTYLQANEIQTPRQLLPSFYRQYQLGDDGGQSSSYVKVELTKKLFVYFPNFDARRKAVFKHDVHHILTGYTSTLKGETEIGAWEIASGCRHYWVAFILDLHGVMMGLLINPLGVYKAFVKGRRTKNLYDDALPDEQVMDTPIAEIRERLLLNNYSGKGNLIDMVLFLLLLLFGVVYSVLSILLLLPVLIYTVYIMTTKK